MRKLLILLFLSFLIQFQFVNATNSNFDSIQPIDGLFVIGDRLNNSTLRNYIRLDDSGNIKWNVERGDVLIDNTHLVFKDMVVELDNGNLIVLERNFPSSIANLVEIDSTGQIISDINLPSYLGQTIKIATNGTRLFGISAINGIVFEFDTLGNILWTNTNHTAKGNDIETNGNYIWTGASDRTLRNFTLDGSQRWSELGDFNGDFRFVIPRSDDVVYGFESRGGIERLNVFNSNGGNISFFNYDPNYEFDDGILLPNGNILVWGEGGGFPDYGIWEINQNNTIINSYPTTLRISRMAYDANEDVFYGFETFGSTVLKFNTSFNVIDSYDLSSETNRIYDIVLAKVVTEPDTYTVDLNSNYAPFTDVLYDDGVINTSGSFISTTIANDQGFQVSSNVIDLGPFSFNFWYDVTNDVIFDSNREFTVNDPDRNYNLVGNYSLNNAVSLTFNSNLPSPPNFILNTKSIENNPVTLNQYPFDDYQFPYNYDFEVTAPTENIGFYEFDYWYDNVNQEVFSLSNTITSSGIENLNLTATYSLPEEYQINLTLESQIGFIEFQHGNLDPITGSVISATIGAGDTWTASAPEDPNFRFTEWFDLDSFSFYSDQPSISVGFTSQNYNLRAFYEELFTVYWDSNGGTPIANQKFSSNESIFSPTDPLKFEFVFGGWINEFNEIQNFPVLITEDVTFTAIWIDVFTVDFQVNGGASVPSQTVLENDTINVVTPSRFGYTFEGWYTDNVTFNNAFDFNTFIDQDETLFAKWAFGTENNAEQSLNVFLVDSNLDDPFAQIIIVLAFFVLLNAIIYVYSGPMIVTLILNFILTALFMVLGFIPFWIIIMIFIAIFGFALLMLFGGRSAA